MYTDSCNYTPISIIVADKFFHNTIGQIYRVVQEKKYNQLQGIVKNSAAILWSYCKMSIIRLFA